ncbi:MAG TPA: hypothetical protein VN577_06615 [Terriglobales bacterium]|nr:hypothetical protein [Terriglobales bacterium]
MSLKSILATTFGVIFRVLLITGIFTLIGFAVGLFLGIAASMLYGVLRHTHPDMTMAYRFVAVPFALMALVITFCVMLYTEIRRLRRPLEFSRTSAFRRTS